MTYAKMLAPYVVFPKLTLIPTDDGSTKFITMAVDDNGNISTTDGSGLRNEFATEAYVDGRIQEDAVIIKSSTPNSTKKFKFTVDDDYNVSATNTSNSVSKTLATTEYVDNYVGSMIDAAIGNAIGGSY